MWTGQANSRSTMRHCEVSMQHSFFRFFGASDLTLQDFDCQPLEGSDRGLFHRMVLLLFVLVRSWSRKWLVRMGHYHHGFRVVEIVVRFLSATHGARRSDIKNKATTTESRWESWAMRMWLQCHWWCWLAPGMAENFYGRAGIELETR